MKKNRIFEYHSKLSHIVNFLTKLIGSDKHFISPLVKNEYQKHHQSLNTNNDVFLQIFDNTLDNKNKIYPESIKNHVYEIIFRIYDIFYEITPKISTALDFYDNVTYDPVIISITKYILSKYPNILPIMNIKKQNTLIFILFTFYLSEIYLFHIYQKESDTQSVKRISTFVHMKHTSNILLSYMKKYFVNTIHISSHFIQRYLVKNNNISMLSLILDFIIDNTDDLTIILSKKEHFLTIYHDMWNIFILKILKKNNCYYAPNYDDYDYILDIQIKKILNSTLAIYNSDLDLEIKKIIISARTYFNISYLKKFFESIMKKETDIPDFITLCCKENDSDINIMNLYLKENTKNRKIIESFIKVYHFLEILISLLSISELKDFFDSNILDTLYDIIKMIGNDIHIKKKRTPNISFIKPNIEDTDNNYQLNQDPHLSDEENSYDSLFYSIYNK
jgi:hypothetical protein